MLSTRFMPIPFQPPMSLSYQNVGGGGSGLPEPGGSRRLKIAFLVPEDRQTGTYFRYHNLAIALRQLGHQVTVYSQSSRNRLRATRELRDGVPYVLSATVPGNRWMLPPTNPGTFLRRWFTTVEKADVYHLFQPFPSAGLTWLRLKRSRPGLFVYDWDDFWINEEFGLKNPQGFRARWASYWVARLERSLPGECHLATTVSHPLAELATAWRCPRSTVVYNGVWPQAKRDKQKAREALGLDPHAVYVGLMGWSGEVEWCLEAVRMFAGRFPNLRLAITGRDPGNILSRYADISSRIHYLGALPDELFAHFNPAIDLGLVPMRATEFNQYRLPYKLTDHLAGGTPVLCTRVGEAIRLADSLEGITSCEPTLDAWLNAFQQKIQCLTTHPAALEVPTEPLLKHFSWLKIAREMTEAYLDAMATEPRHHHSSR
jgi:glycosyltransferase involved in cell wall biosynthesis